MRGKLAGDCSQILGVELRSSGLVPGALTQQAISPALCFYDHRLELCIFLRTNMDATWPFRSIMRRIHTVPIEMIYDCWYGSRSLDWNGICQIPHLWSYSSLSCGSPGRILHQAQVRRAAFLHLTELHGLSFTCDFPLFNTPFVNLSILAEMY